MRAGTVKASGRSRSRAPVTAAGAQPADIGAAGPGMISVAALGASFALPVGDVIDVKAEDLDTANGFDCLRIDGTGHAATASRGVVVLYVLYGKRYSDSTPVQAIAD